ncbi:restriction endonuclease subunit S [Paraeggerthella sp. Marseille-Q4926]|uniref:restriction endonuclease subunit S n=1 Tax=Paraeggerthella sp. Marseille-Q4926 TaxID=2866587 RepID=UPI001CE4317E|nr:restriction endonuclease subunit S [Paraeggerthella sp. Marseille-Q4926]
MNKNWETVRASEFCDSVRDGTHDSPKPCDKGFKLVTSKHISNGVLDLTRANTISESDYQAINKRSKVNRNDILFSMIGTVGNIYRVDIEPNFAIKNVGLFKISDEIKSKYLYYYLESSFAKDYIFRSLAGSTQQYLSLKALRAFPISYPKDEQVLYGIVGVLDSIQNKITANTLLNDYLAEMCEVVAGAMNIKGTTTLTDISTQVTARVACEESTIESYVSTESLLPEKGGRQIASALPSTGKVTVYQPGDTLVSNIRPYFKKVWYADCIGTCSGDVIVFRANNPKLAPYLYSVLRSDGYFEHVMTGAKGTKMPRGDKKQMMQYPVASKCDERGLEILASILNKISTNNRENARLLELRDALLPKLMSGEIDVSQVYITQLNNHLPEKYVQNIN